MISSWDIYWLTRLEPIHNLTGLIGFFSTFAAFFTVIGYLITQGSENKQEKAASKTLGKLSFFTVPLAVISVLITTLLPSMKGVAAIIVVPKVINAVAQTEDFKQIPTNIVDLANSWLVELKPKVKDSK